MKLGDKQVQSIRLTLNPEITIMPTASYYRKEIGPRITRRGPGQGTFGTLTGWNQDWFSPVDQQKLGLMYLGWVLSSSRRNDGGDHPDPTFVPNNHLVSPKALNSLFHQAHQTARQ